MLDDSRLMAYEPTSLQASYIYNYINIIIYCTAAQTCKSIWTHGLWLVAALSRTQYTHEPLFCSGTTWAPLSHVHSSSERHELRSSYGDILEDKYGDILEDKWTHKISSQGSHSAELRNILTRNSQDHRQSRKESTQHSKEMQRTDQSLLSFLQHLATKALVNCHQARWHRGIATLCSHIHILPTCNKTLSLLQLSYIHLALQGEFMFKDCTYILYDSLITLIRREW